MGYTTCSVSNKKNKSPGALMTTRLKTLCAPINN